MKICACCKQPVEDALGVITEHGIVHVGYCLEMANELPLIEGEGEEQLTETTLLL